MTNSQLQYAKLLEDRRHNMEAEHIDRIKNSETERSNRAKEYETNRSNRAKEFETNRANRAKEADTDYANETGRMKASADYTVNQTMAEIAQQNADIRQAELDEAARHNTHQEIIGYIKAGSDIADSVSKFIPGGKSGKK